MLNSDAEQSVMDFPMSAAKPGHYSDQELPKVPTSTKQLDNPIQKQESNLEKIYQITTSLPVSTTLLAAVTSQGMPVGGSLWYLNYSAILVILLTAVAVAISYLSTTASHSYCETVFLSIYTPASQLFNVTVSLRDVHQAEEPRNERATRHATPAWFKQLLFVCITLSATQGLSIVAVVYATCVTVVYTGLSTQLKLFSNKQTVVLQKPKLVLSQRDYSYIAIMLLAVAADIFVSGSVGVMHLLYFILTDKNTVAAIETLVENRNIEVMEGLEQYYAKGLVYLAEITLTFSAIFIHPCVCLLYIPVFYFCIYQPIQQFKVNVRTINGELLCMSNFQKATTSDISQYDDVCAVCLCAMKHARITPCKHIFHAKCLKDCLKKKAQCPMCNSQML